MNNKELKGALTEIVHLATAAVIGDDISLSRLAIGDIKDILRGLDEREAERQEAASEEPQHDEAAAKAKAAAKHGGKVRVAKTPTTVAFQVDANEGRKISAELHNETTISRAHAWLWDGDKAVCKIEFFGQYQGRSWAYPIVRRSLNGLMSKAGKAGRYRDNQQRRVAAQEGEAVNG